MLITSNLSYVYEVTQKEVNVTVVENNSEDHIIYDLPNNYYCCAVVEGSMVYNNNIFKTIPLFFSSGATQITVNGNTKIAIYHH